MNEGPATELIPIPHVVGILDNRIRLQKLQHYQEWYLRTLSMVGPSDVSVFSAALGVGGCGWS